MILLGCGAGYGAFKYFSLAKIKPLLSLLSSCALLICVYLFFHNLQIFNFTLATDTDTYYLFALAFGNIFSSYWLGSNAATFSRINKIIPEKITITNMHRVITIAYFIIFYITLFYFFLEPSKMSFFFISASSVLMATLCSALIDKTHSLLVKIMLVKCLSFLMFAIGYIMSNILLIAFSGLIMPACCMMHKKYYQYHNISSKKLIFNFFKGFKQQPDATNSESIRAEDCEGQKALNNQINASDAIFMINNAKSVVIIPGLGALSSECHHEIKVLLERLIKQNALAKIALHPMAGRHPCSITDLINKAGIKHQHIAEISNVNFESVDLALCIGANDIINEDFAPNSSNIYNNNISSAANIIYINRNKNAGYSGRYNKLFKYPNTYHLQGDAKTTLVELLHLPG